MDRRSFVAAIVGGLTSVALAAETPQTGRMRRIGFLSLSTPPSLAEEAPFWEPLQKLGWVEGQNLVIERRYVSGRTEQIQRMAEELVRLDVELIVGNGTVASLASKGVTATAPIVVRRSGDQALIVGAESLFAENFSTAARTAQRLSLPIVVESRYWLDKSALVSYGPSDVEFARKLDVFIGKILKGAGSGDLPIEQPAKFELVINLKTAKALGVTIPKDVLLRADEVIQ